MRRIMLKLLVLALLVYVGLCIVLFVRQRSMLYFPQPRAAGSEIATISLASDDGPVLASTRPHAGPNAVLYFGGNAEDVSVLVPSLSETFPGHAIYALHYRGFGGSAGAPTEAALFADAAALFDKVHAEHGKVVVIGRSLGSGVAAWLASRRPVARLVLVTPYESVKEVAAGQFPYFPVGWLLRDKYESWRYAEQISVPTLLLMAEHDNIIPRASTEALYRHFPNGVASLRTVAGTDHVNIVDSPEYVRLLKGGP